MTDDRKNTSAPIWCTLLLGIVLAYPASFGPWVYFVCRFHPPAPLVTAGAIASQPMEFILERIMPDPIASLYGSYIDWWIALSGNPIRC